MKIKAELIKGKELQPGDLFSTLEQQHWDNMDQHGLFERICIRTNRVTDEADGETKVYRLTVERDA